MKICGITSVADAVAAVEAGADAIGLNFVGGPRRIDVDRAREILCCLPALVTPVALVKVEDNRLADSLVEWLGERRVSHVQVYGDVTVGCLAALGREGFRAVPVIAVKDEAFADAPPAWMLGEAEVRPCAVVLDRFDPTRQGGTGRPFRWEWVSAARDMGKLADWPPMILAGGLNPDNVVEAIRIVRPYAVDVSSGVEVEGSPGRKDRDKMRAFVRSARLADEGMP